MHPELSRFVRRSTHHGAIPAPCDDNRLAAELRIVALFYGRIERVISTWMILRVFIWRLSYAAVGDASVRPQTYGRDKEAGCTTC